MTASWTQGGRSGLAGLVADSNGGNGTFQVNYVLIQAAGLPTITAGVPTPEPSSLLLSGCGATGLASFAFWRWSAKRHAAEIQPNNPHCQPNLTLPLCSPFSRPVRS